MIVREEELVARIDTLTVRRLRTWVRKGWVRPRSVGRGRVFTEADAARVRLLCELRDDLDIGEDALPVVLNLLDQIHGLRGELRDLLAAVEDQPEAVRREIVRAFCERRGESR